MTSPSPQDNKLIKVEIAIVDKDNREWQWLGRLSEASLTALTAEADKLSDKDTETQNGRWT